MGRLFGCILTRGGSQNIHLDVLSLVSEDLFSLSEIALLLGCCERFQAGESKVIGAMQLDPFSFRLNVFPFLTAGSLCLPRVIIPFKVIGFISLANSHYHTSSP